jgi:predicted alpha/beta superfamily hydrolase
MKIHFKNTAGLDKVFTELYSTDGSPLGSLMCEDEVEYGGSTEGCLRFSSECGERTGRLFPGDSGLGIEYKDNLALGRRATYLHLDGCTVSGRVDNYTLKDEKNLAHRKDGSKKISVFVPSTYDNETPHDILYFFDAQNLFSLAGDYTENGDPYGSWQLDLVICELKRRLGKNIIVVGIDNADEYRSQELFMHPDKFGKLSPLATAIPEDDFSKGYLDGLSDFMTGTLHSFIKSKYNVKEDNIGIGGSSMGGIASFYCALRNRGFYSYALCYSPAFGLYEMSAFDGYFANCDFEKAQNVLPKIHIYCGEGDPLEKLLIPASQEMKSLMVKHGYPADRIYETYDEEKPHNEESWRLILPQSFSLLF